MKYVFRTLIALLFAMSLCGCKQAVQKATFVAQVEAAKKQMPMKVTDGVTCISLEIVDDFVTYKQIYESDYAETAKYLLKNSDEQQLVNIVSQMLDFAKQTAEAGFGIQYIYIEQETMEEFGRIKADKNKLADIVRRIESGEVRSNTYLEQVQNELNSMNLPMQISDALIVKSAQIVGRKICYDYELQTELLFADLEISESDIESEKAEVAKDLSKSINPNYKQSMFDEQVSFLYTVKNKNGELLYSYEVTPEDIWK